MPIQTETPDPIKTLQNQMILEAQENRLRNQREISLGEPPKPEETMIANLRQTYKKTPLKLRQVPQALKTPQTPKKMEKQQETKLAPRIAENVQKSGACSDKPINRPLDTETTETNTVEQPKKVDKVMNTPEQIQETTPENKSFGEYSDKALIEKLLHSEDRFNAIEGQIVGLKTAITSVTENMTGVINHVNNVSTEINTAFTGIKELLGKQQEQQQQAAIQRAQPAPGSSASSIAANNMQAEEQSFTGLGNSGIPGILDRLIQFYLVSKQNQPAPQVDPGAAFMGSLQTSVDLLRSMSNLVSGLKKDWIQEEKLVHNIEKTKNIDKK